MNKLPKKPKYIKNFGYSKSTVLKPNAIRTKSKVKPIVTPLINEKFLKNHD